VRPLNECAACGEDFASLRAFDLHVLSKPAEPIFDCMQIGQMQQAGWSRDNRGRWSSPELRERAQRTREYFEEAA
jgi:hypothetical protein